jgi:uncharacterized protein YkwD
MKTSKIICFLLILFTLTACSSEESGDSGNNANSACGSMNELSCEMFHAVNTYRINQGKHALVANEKCIALAQDHAVDMVVRNFFSHNSPTETFQQRVARYGLFSFAGENIAMGSDNVPHILSMWQNSPGHNTNMLNSNYQSSGVGYYEGRWVQCFSGETN